MRSFPVQADLIQTSRRGEMVELTARIQQWVDRKHLANGVLTVFLAHTSAGICINENGTDDVKADILRKLELLIPQSEAFYQHDEGNSDAHVKAAIIGCSVTLIIEGGKIILGPRQGIQLCEFDGPRERKILLKFIGEVNDLS